MNDKRDYRVHKRISYERILDNVRVIRHKESELLEEEQFSLKTHDLSKGGIGVASTIKISTGIFLKFDIILENIQYDVMGIVKWRHKDDINYRYGIEFIGIANMFYRHIHLITNKKSFFDQKSEGQIEKRRHERYPIVQEVLSNEIYYEINGKREQIKGINIKIRNLSFQGAGINSSEKLNVGDILIFQCFFHNEISSFKGKIVWSKYNLNGSIGMRYEAGIEFMDLKVKDLYNLYDIFTGSGYYIQE